MKRRKKEVHGKNRKSDFDVYIVLTVIVICFPPSILFEKNLPSASEKMDLPAQKEKRNKLTAF